MKNYLLFLLIIAVGLSCFQCQSSVSLDMAEKPKFDQNDIHFYLDQLAADSFQGRKPFTEGEAITINFLKDEFEKMGLNPGNGDSYFQEVPLVEITGQPDKTMKVRGKTGDFDLALDKDYSITTQRVQDSIAIENAELVFCGFGIVAPEYNWNDYEGIDMTDKIAVVMVNDPGFQSGDSSLFKGNTMTYYGRWTYKYEEAARQGAKGILIIHETNAAGYPWFVVKSSWSGGNLGLQTPNDNMDRCAIEGWLSLGATSKIFKATGMKNARFFEKAGTPGFKPIPLGVNISVGLKNSFKKDKSYNVVATLPGAERPEEYIIYTAHWDHLGIGESVSGDSIYNGAVDNATGSASIMTIARAFSRLKNPPERTVVFLMVTAEEQGLLGSAYYAQNPIFPVENTVANLNMDGMNANGAMNDLTITGYGQSEMDDYAKVAAENQERYIIPDQEPEKGYFFRSDHFSFAKIGIPALYAQGRYDHKEKGKEYAEEKNQDYVTNRYHRPADHYDPATWDLSGLVQDAELFYKIGLKLAQEDYFPRWRQDSEFNGIRERDKNNNLKD